MAGRYAKRNRTPGNAKVRCAGAGAFSAFGLTPVALAPAAQGEEISVILDPVAAASLAATDSTLAEEFQQGFWPPLHSPQPLPVTLQ